MSTTVHATLHPIKLILLVQPGMERVQAPADISRSALCCHTSWRRGIVASVVRRMNEVTLRRARLVLGWVTVIGRVYHHGM